MNTGFWIYMFIMLIVIPTCIIPFGRSFIRNAPQNTNRWFGYRTKMSMKNKDTWQFAHHYFGKLWMRIGLILLPLSVVIMIVFFGNNVDIVGYVGLVLVVAQLAALIAPIFPTEKALKKTFDINGNRK